MAEVDLARRCLRLTGAELEAALTSGGSAPPAPRQPLLALDTGGHAREPNPPWVEELLAVVARPALRVVVETAVAGHLAVYSLWATPKQAVTATPASDGVVELALIDPLLLPWTIAQLVGLGRRPPPPPVAPLRLPASLLDTVEEQVTAGQAVDGALMAAQGLDQAQQAALVRLFQRRRVSWRASSVWAGTDGQQQTSNLAVLDGGEAGLWRVQVPDTEDPDPVFTLEPVRASMIWRGIVGLLPNRRNTRTQGT